MDDTAATGMTLLDLSSFDDLEFLGYVGLLAGDAVQQPLTCFAPLEAELTCTIARYTMVYTRAQLLLTTCGAAEPRRPSFRRQRRIWAHQRARADASTPTTTTSPAAAALSLLRQMRSTSTSSAATKARWLDTFAHAEEGRRCGDAAQCLNLHLLDTGAKNGAKKLRSMLKKTSQWSDAATRAATARKAADAGLDRLVLALVDGHVARLRKARDLERSSSPGTTRGLRSSIWRKRSTFAKKIDLPEISEPSSAGRLKRASGVLFRQSSNESTKSTVTRSTVTAMLSMAEEDLDGDDEMEAVREPAMKKRAAGSAAPAAVPAALPDPQAASALSMTGATACPGASGPTAQSQLEMANTVLPAIFQLIDEAGETIMARATRELCFALGGAGITEAKIQELRTTYSRVGSAAAAIASLKAACEVRLLRLKAAEQEIRAQGLGPFVPEEVLADDLVFEVVMRTAEAQKRKDVSALQASLNARSGLNALDLLDRVTLSAWMKSVDIFHLIVQTLEAARKSNSAIAYLEASVLMQEGIRRYRQVFEVTYLYQLGWAEDVMRLAQRREEEEAAAMARFQEPAHDAAVLMLASAGAEEELLPLDALYAALGGMEQVVRTVIPPA